MSQPRLTSVPPPPDDIRSRLTSTENAVADTLVEMQERETRLLSQIEDLKKENERLHRSHRQHESGLARALSTLAAMAPG